MPTYEYKCPTCDHTISETRSIHADEPQHTCPTCKAEMHQVVNKIGVSFKGSGFYRNDKNR